MSPQRRSVWVSGVIFPVRRNDNCVYCAFLGWRPNEFSISLFQRHCSKANIDGSRKLHGCVSKWSFFLPIFQTASGIVRLPSASVDALKHMNTIQPGEKMRQKIPPSVLMLVKKKTANNLHVAPCVPALTGHTTPCHSAVSGSVTNRTFPHTTSGRSQEQQNVFISRVNTLDLLIKWIFIHWRILEKNPHLKVWNKWGFL